MIGRTWKDFGKLFTEISHLIYVKYSIGFGNVDIGVIIWATEDIISGLHVVHYQNRFIHVYENFIQCLVCY